MARVEYCYYLFDAAGRFFLLSYKKTHWRVWKTRNSFAAWKKIRTSYWTPSNVPVHNVTRHKWRILPIPATLSSKTGSVPGFGNTVKGTWSRVKFSSILNELFVHAELKTLGRFLSYLARDVFALAYVHAVTAGLAANNSLAARAKCGPLSSPCFKSSLRKQSNFRRAPFPCIVPGQTLKRFDDEGRMSSSDDIHASSLEKYDALKEKMWIRDRVEKLRILSFCYISIKHNSKMYTWENFQEKIGFIDKNCSFLFLNYKLNLKVIHSSVCTRSAITLIFSHHFIERRKFKKS